MKLKVTLTRSTIGTIEDQRRTVRALGLGKLNSCKIQPDNPAIRGMLFKVRHLVTVEEVAEEV